MRKKARAAAAGVLLVGAAAVAAAQDQFPAMPNLTKQEWAASAIGGVLIALGSLWNRKGTKAVETKTDQQTVLLTETLGAVVRMGGSLDEVREAQRRHGDATAVQLAAHAEQLRTHGLQLSTHGLQLVTLADGLARVQTTKANGQAPKETRHDEPAHQAREEARGPDREEGPDGEGAGSGGG